MFLLVDCQDENSSFFKGENLTMKQLHQQHQNESTRAEDSNLSIFVCRAQGWPTAMQHNATRNGGYRPTYRLNPTYCMLRKTPGYQSFDWYDRHVMMRQNNQSNQSKNLCWCKLSSAQVYVEPEGPGGTIPDMWPVDCFQDAPQVCWKMMRHKYKSWNLFSFLLF